MRTPRISVAIPFHNAEHTLRYAIESVLQQTFTDFELLLVNDGSNDGSLSVASAYLKEPRVRLLGGPRNLGLAARLNQIAHAAAAPLLARMDANGLMHPRRLELQAKFFESRPAVDLLGTGIWLIDHDYRVLGRTVTPLARPCERLQFLQFFDPTVMGKKDWFLRNPYSTRFSRSEDIELWYRAARESVFAHLPDPLFFHLPSFVVDTRKTATPLRQYREIRLMASTYLRISIFRALDRMGMTEKAVLTFGSQTASPPELAEATRVLQSIRRNADGRVAERRLFAVSPRGESTTRTKK